MTNCLKYKDNYPVLDVMTKAETNQLLLSRNAISVLGVPQNNQNPRISSQSQFNLFPTPPYRNLTL